ncbi:hypothetical protein GPECTOR_45g115 [Gonium pectorale]|uniref:histidine kinase n=1 Tax=Gonium pectorale TaxID=33097 RepID=A0A150G9K7_GONPE|nr:hypothetical protein GPECTOR_45g115 [Gonium pectorale]|eukprot:KXZ46245.1 hypothetical protein GPECTOR_45g115 [Gonium pectorale]
MDSQALVFRGAALDIVPAAVYDRSTSIFLTALAIDLLNILFERQTIKLDCVLLPTFIKGMASTTNVLVRFYTPVVGLTNLGRPVVIQRYICWMHTTPSILMLLKMISTSITPREAAVAILFDEIMVVTGVIALVTTGWQRVFWSCITHLAMLPVVPYMHKAFTEAMEQVRTRPLQLTMLCIYVLNLILWCTFAVTWDLALLGWISVMTEEVLYVACDFSAKVLFSSTLMLSSFKEFEARRESAMRVIESSSKAKLIAELQALLEQKERFMSSVSHELRTPLNGIIGISEGMLSGCCGVLPEGVRRQIYIIRTSGARLLALINDVMDAAALRQNKLVLKQEQVVLRHVVDDVLDLTRSLVDSEVQLVNLVPPRMLVVGDTGRIVQILNNLLGNAAKFTRRGQIRVTARQVEGGRKVAVTVSDTGIGIPRNKLATIFLPFEQVDMSISRKYGGFGLGLNIVQELVKAHGGTINVSSIEGKGSTFTFTLPLARAMGRESLEEAKAAAKRSQQGLGIAITDASSSQVGGGSVSGSGAGPAGKDGTSGSVTASGISPRGAGGGDDSSTIVSSSDASRRPGQKGSTAGGVPNPAEVEQYGELNYNAAELSALASSRPYAQSARESLPASYEGNRSSSAHSPSIQPAVSMRSGRSGGPPSAAPVPARSRGDSSISGAGGAAVGGTSDVPQLASDAKIVHGPRPFHYTMYKRFLLLSVDDDHVNQSVIKSLLSSTGYEVVAVPSGPEALRYVSTAPALPDLVLLDCMMPEMDGYEVLQRLRAMTPHVHLPIIMVSAQTEEDHVVCGLDLGADDYVTKPFKRNELLARIRAQLVYGDWEQDEGALETLSSLAIGEVGGASAGHASPGNGGSSMHILDSGNNMGDAAHAAAAAAAAAATAALSPGGLADSGRRNSLPGVGGSDQRLIVCIDDDDVNQVVLQGMLTSQHYRYVRASTGSQGLSYVCGTNSGGIPPDLVLLDCSLPDMTGFDVCRCIRQMYNKQQVPIIMLSARHNESAVVEGLKCGANTYVTKPFRRNELLARIRLHLRSREAHHGSTPDSSNEDSDPRAGSNAASALTDAGASTPGKSSNGGRALQRAHDPVVASAAAAVGPGSMDAVRVWPEAAVLVVAVADYGGLCRMLLPAEMAELSGRMLAAFDRAVTAHGAVRVEASSGVMSAAMLPAAVAPGPGAAADPADAALGLRLATLHRVGRALIEAAATIGVPGTNTCLQLQQALALGPLMGHSTPPVFGGLPGQGGGAGSGMLYFGPVLAELLDLARRAPPMTIVTPDMEAQALRSSGATADIRGPLFLEADDVGGPAAAALAARRLWLVEAHPLAHQYLPPQLLHAASNVLRAGGFFNRSGTDDMDKSSLAASTVAGPSPLGPRGGGQGGSTLASGLSGGAGGGAGSASHGHGAAGGSSLLGAGEHGGQAAASAASTSVGFNTSLGFGLYGGHNISRAASRAFSQTFGLDSDALGRMGQQLAASGGNTGTGSGNGASQGSGATTGVSPGGATGSARGGGGSTGSPLGGGQNMIDSSSGGAAGITFSLQAAAAAVGASTGGGSGPSGVAANADLYSIGGGSSVLLSVPPSNPFAVPHAPSGPSFLYGTAATPGLRASGGVPSAVGGGGSGSQVSPSEQDAMAEPHIRALRNELAVMRQQLEALQSGSASVRSEAHAGTSGGSHAQPPPTPQALLVQHLQQQQQQAAQQQQQPQHFLAPAVQAGPQHADSGALQSLASVGEQGLVGARGSEAGGGGLVAAASGSIGGESLGAGLAEKAQKKGSKLTRLFGKSSKSGAK